MAIRIGYWSHALRDLSSKVVDFRLRDRLPESDQDHRQLPWPGEHFVTTASATLDDLKHDVLGLPGVARDAIAPMRHSNVIAESYPQNSNPCQARMYLRMRTKALRPSMPASSNSIKAGSPAMCAGGRGPRA